MPHLNIVTDTHILRGNLNDFAFQTKPAVKTHESFDIPGNGGSGGLMVPQAPSAVRRHSTGNTTASEAAAVAMVASPAEYQPKPGPRGANGSMDMSAAAAAMQQKYGLLQISEGRRLKREYFILNFSPTKAILAVSLKFIGKSAVIRKRATQKYLVVHELCYVTSLSDKVQ